MVIEADDTDVEMPLVNSILNSPAGATSSMSSITADSLLRPPGGAASVASALPEIRSRSNSLALYSLTSRRVKPPPIAAAVASLQQIGVTNING